MILYINACARSISRTKRLADAVKEAALGKIDDTVEEIRLFDIDFPKTDESFLNKRDDLIAKGKFDDEGFALARQFAKADLIIIAAPFWDLSFPAVLKQYIEHINVTGITFEYTEDGIPKGLCRAKTLVYVSTAGGNFVPKEYGFNYVKTFAQSFYGIGDVRYIEAAGLDIYGADAERTVSLAIKEAADVWDGKTDSDKKGQNINKDFEECLNNKGDKTILWEEVESKHLISDEWIDFRSTAFKLPDGSVFEPFYNYSRRNYVVIVATDTNGDYLIVRQYRPGIRSITNEFPAGGIERTDGKEYGPNDEWAEEALDAAKRELMEETGYESDDWRSITVIPSAASISANYAYLFEAKNCRKVGGQNLDDTEHLNVYKISKSELEQLIAERKFEQAVHVMAYLLAER